MSIPKWTGILIGKMHNNSISKKDLAGKLNFSQEYISMVLNGKKTPKGARERFEATVEEIIKERDSI